MFKDAKQFRLPEDQILFTWVSHLVFYIKYYDFEDIYLHDSMV